MKNLIFDLLVWIHSIKPFPKVYHTKIYPFVTSFKTVKYIVDYTMDIYNNWYDFDSLLMWRNDNYVKSRDRWHSYFDRGIGCLVDDPSILRRHEAEGHIWTTFNESERYCAKRRAEVKKEQKAKIRKSIMESLREVKQGRSFYKEHLAQIPHDMKLKTERENKARELSGRN